VNLAHPLVRIPLWLFAIYVGLCVLVYVVQRKMMYFPDPEPVAAEPGMEDVALETADGVTVRATWWPGNRPVTILLLHGNAGHRGHRFPWMRRFHRLGWSVFLLDYRGYGGSDGSPSQPGIARDADAAAAWLRAHRPDDAVVYFGESIGGSVAVDLASRTRPAAVVLQSAGYDLTDVGKEHYAWLPLGLMLKDTWSARGKIEDLDVPLLSIHGTRDRIVPPAHGRRMFDASPSADKEWYAIEDAGHNDVEAVGGAAYIERVHRFLERATAR